MVKRSVSQDRETEEKREKRKEWDSDRGRRSRKQDLISFPSYCIFFTNIPSMRYSEPLRIVL